MQKKKPSQAAPFKLTDEPIVPGGNPPPVQFNLQQAMARAEQFQAAGKLQRSEAELRQILQKAPRFAPAVHLLGVIAHQAGKPDLAVELIEKGVVSAERLVTHRFSLDRTAEAFALTAKAEDSMKSLIVFDE